jgi:hypothetical protein
MRAGTQTQLRLSPTLHCFPSVVPPPTHPLTPSPTYQSTIIRACITRKARRDSGSGLLRIALW